MREFLIPKGSLDMVKTYNNLLPVDEPKYFSDIRDLYRSSAVSFGNKVLYYYTEDEEKKQLSYAQFWNTIRAFGSALYKYGLDKARIAIVGDTHPYWTAAFVCALSCGGVAVPLDKELDDDQMIAFMKRAKCTAVVYTSCMNKRLTSRLEELSFIDYFIPIHPTGETFSGGKVIAYDDLLSEGRLMTEQGDDRFESSPIDMEKMSALLFTSGTTGTSKGVMLSHKNFTSCVRAACNATQYGVSSTFVSVLPIHHTFELSTQHLAMSNLGGTVLINESLRYATKNFKEFKPNNLILVPLFLETVHKKIWNEIRKKGIERRVRTAMKAALGMLRIGVDVRPRLFSQITAAFGGALRSIVVGGAPIDPEIVKDFYAFGITVVQGYGITECAPLIAVNRPGRVKFDSVGEVVDCCEVRIDPIEGSTDGEGEILVRGDNVMIGYYEDEEATAAVFTSDGYFRTGDIGYLDEDDFIHITGRKKNVIIASNGKNVFPEEIEERLLKFDLIKECVVLQRAEDIVALVYPDPERNLSDEEAQNEVKDVITSLNKTLPTYKHIAKFELRSEEFEKTPTKKIKRFLLH